MAGTTPVTLIQYQAKHVDYAWEIAKKLRDRNLSRADVDERSEKMQFKIRASQTQKDSLPIDRWGRNGREGCKRSPLWSKKQKPCR